VAGAQPAAPAANGRADARGGPAPPEGAPGGAAAQPSAGSEAGGGGGGGSGGKDTAREGLEARIEQLEMDLLKVCGAASPPPACLEHSLFAAGCGCLALAHPAHAAVGCCGLLGSAQFPKQCTTGARCLLSLQCARKALRDRRAVHTVRSDTYGRCSACSRRARPPAAMAVPCTTASGE